MASPPDPGLTRLARELANLLVVLVILALGLIVTGLALSWSGGLSPGVAPDAGWMPGDPGASARYHLAANARALLNWGEGVMVASPLVGIARLIVAGRRHGRLAVSAAATLAVVLAGGLLAR